MGTKWPLQETKIYLKRNSRTIRAKPLYEAHKKGKTMAIYGVGAYYDANVSREFIQKELVGVGWDANDAPELQEYFKPLKVGDIVYIKAAFGGTPEITIKGIGIIKDNTIRTRSDTNDFVETGRNVIWLNTDWFTISRPAEKNNVRSNTAYEEFHPIVQKEIIDRISAQSRLNA